MSPKSAKQSAEPVKAAPTTTKKKQNASRRFILTPVELAAAALLALAAYAYFHFRVAYKEELQSFRVGGLGLDDSIPSISHAHLVEDTAKKQAVEAAFRNSWAAYERDAYGYDNYHPISHGGSNLEKEGIGYFIVDCLDSLLLFGMKEEYERAREWVAKLSFDTDARHHAFETTIRVLGGLLAAHHLTGDPLYSEKAKDLGDRLLPIFDTPSGIPASFINLKKRKLIHDADNNNWASVAEAGTLQLELRYLSHVTGNPVYWQKAHKALDRILQNPVQDGLVPLFLDPQTGTFVASDIRLGSRGDSYYEYLLKLYAQSNFTETRWRDAYDAAAGGIQKHLVKISPRDKLLYTIELVARPNYQMQRMEYQPTPKQDHLVCFFPGLFFLAVTNGNRQSVDPAQFDDRQSDQWFLASELLRTCMATYTQTKTGLSPEIAFFRTPEVPGPADDGRDWFVDKRVEGAPPPLDARNILRPETVESLFVAYRSTGDQRYRDWAWQIFEAFEKHCKIESGGYASILDVDQLPVVHENKMETFFLAETLKYLYLIFSDESVMPLDKHVFTTEAHILPILKFEGTTTAV